MSANWAFKYTSLPAKAQLRVAIHPDSSSNWCQYPPDQYKLPVFTRGIFQDAYMGSVTGLKETVVEPWLKEFIETNPEAFLGDGFRHIEAGFVFPEEEEEVGVDESLAPMSAPPLSIITETDRTIEKWKIRVGWTLHVFATYFRDYASFTQFMKLLEGNLTRGINKSLGLIVKSVMCSDPSQTMFDDKDIARIFGRTKDNLASNSPAQDTAITPINSKQGRKWNTLMRKVIQKYYGKAIERWPNIRWYNATFFSHSNEIEEMNKAMLFEDSKGGKDKAKRQMQQLYTDAHKHNTESSGEKTHYDMKTWRVDSLMALVDALVKALIKMTTEETTEMWLGNDTSSEISDTKEGKEKLLQELKRGAGLEGHPLPEGSPQFEASPYSNSSTSLSYSEGFEVVASPSDLILLLNPEDYIDLEIGVARRGQMDTRAVNLDMLRSRVSAIYPMRGMKAGFARVIDKRAFKIMPFFELTDMVQPAEKIAWRAITHFQFAVVMFNLFAGFLLVPSPHFIASPDFYDKKGLIGQDVESKE